ncbi:translation elongation factor Ts [Candidatus Tisiphia endosymbiont of Nemotelus uliginosus]|uniref:translation elongation factor Ts n=1 Tax=Candidatus Tisiphia endosymbiont of Nemotelus uliginosus TaxID=3077926 RepID=UPI0035C90D2E
MVDASLVKQLREKSGAGMMDCKKALVETNGDFEKAIDWLRTKGLSTAAKKANRIATEGVTAVKVQEKTGVIVEVNSETDFVARNVKFQQLVDNITELGLHYDNLESLKIAKTPSGKTVNEEILDNIATIGENLTLRRMNLLTVSEGIVSSYVHNAIVNNQGKISVLIGLESTVQDKSTLSELGRKIAIHIAANNPYSLDAASLEQAVIDRERKIFIEQSQASGKPDNIIEKMVEGRIRKFLAEVVLLEQNFLFDDKLTIAQVIKKAEIELGGAIKISRFIRYELGEGIVQEEKNFANEVAAVIQA